MIRISAIRLGQLLLTDEDFIDMTRAVKQWADSSCKGRLVSCLEGGYNLETLGETVRAHVEELATDDTDFYLTMISSHACQ